MHGKENFPGASGSLPGGTGKARGRRDRMVHGMEGMPLGQTPGRGTCTGAFEKTAPLYQRRKIFPVWEAAFIPICCVHTHSSRSMGTLALQPR